VSQREPLHAILARLTGRLDADGDALGPRRERTRARIVDAATEHLLEVGYGEMRVDAVAASASVTRPTLYAYFESKAHLLIAAMAEEAFRQLPHIAPLFDDERPAKERLREWARESVAYIVSAPLHARMARDRDPEVLRILMEHEAAREALLLNPELDKARLLARLVRESFPGVFSEREAGEVASVIRALSHMAPVLLDERARFGLSVERVAELLSEMLVVGMEAQGGG
jgi:AcrR family transcriptional regulator